MEGVSIRWDEQSEDPFSEDFLLGGCALQHGAKAEGGTID